MGNIGIGESTDEGAGDARRNRWNHDDSDDKPKAAAKGTAEDACKKSDQQ